MNAKMLFRNLLLVFVIGISVVYSFAAAPLLDVTITEQVYESVEYNPLNPAVGLYADLGENQSVYTTTGLINISNVHATQAAQDIVINLSNISNIYNVTHISGNTGYIAEFNTVGDYMILIIPDVGPNNSTIFSYNLNQTTIQPPLNLTSSYSDVRTFAGLPITVNDSIENVLNGSLYTNSCIYNISLVNNALSLNNSGTQLNFSYTPASLAGTDSGNAVQSGDNRQINWTVNAGGCLNATQTTDVNYELQTPSGVDIAQNYDIINTTFSYQYNSTFSLLNLTSIQSVVDIDLEFEKYLDSIVSADNGTWQVSSRVNNPSDVDFNLTSVSLWVSQRNATGTGFTNPSTTDFDTINGSPLNVSYTPNVLLNSTTGNWSNPGTDWFFNYTISQSPIVWMDLEGVVIDDGLQLQDRAYSTNQNSIYVKELYLATGYWLQISRNITRLSNNTYNIFIEVVNLGTSPTPVNQAVQVYNFIPNTFNLSSPFVYSTSTWYTTTAANETLTDPIYNGTMFQYGIIATNAINSSLDSYNGTQNVNNTWSVTYNVTGQGQFNFDDLFLTGVDPLNVEDIGGSEPLKVKSNISLIGAKVEYILGSIAILLGVVSLII